MQILLQKTKIIYHKNRKQLRELSDKLCKIESEVPPTKHTVSNILEKFKVKDKYGGKKEMKCKLLLLEEILKEKKKSNHDEFLFSDFLDVLQMLNMISNSISSAKEKSLISKSWHLISYYQAGDIVSSSENIQVFVSGVLGITDKSVFRYTHSSKSKSLDNSSGGIKISKIISDKIFSNFEDEYKLFKFTSMVQLESLRKEFEQLKICKSNSDNNLELDIKLDKGKFQDSISPMQRTTRVPTPWINSIDDILMQKSSTPTESDIKPKKQTHSEFEHPTLELDVYITENHMEKLIVYKNDSPQSISNEFCQKYNLSTEKRDVLISVIKNQISKVLTCISEVDEDND